MTLPTPAHGALLERALVSLRSDRRVLAILLGGSLASGEPDEESDIDLTVVLDDDAADEFSLELERWLRRVGDPVAVTRGPVPNLVASLMRDGVRFDVTVERRSSMAARPRRAVLVLHDPFGVSTGGDVVTPRFEPTGKWLRQSVEDFLRFLDQLSVVVLRQEWIAGIDNCWYLISQLLDLYAHRNRAARTSARRVNDRLTWNQREAIESLPPIRSDERSIVDVHMAVAELYLPEAEQFCKELGLEWPQELEQTVVEHVARRTGARLSRAEYDSRRRSGKPVAGQDRIQAD